MPTSSDDDCIAGEQSSAPTRRRRAPARPSRSHAAGARTARPPARGAVLPAVRLASAASRSRAGDHRDDDADHDRDQSAIGRDGAASAIGTGSAVALRTVTSSAAAPMPAAGADHGGHDAQHDRLADDRAEHLPSRSTDAAQQRQVARCAGRRTIANVLAMTSAATNIATAANALSIRPIRSTSSVSELVACSARIVGRHARPRRARAHRTWPRASSATHPVAAPPAAAPAAADRGPSRGWAGRRRTSRSRIAGPSPARSARRRSYGAARRPDSPASRRSVADREAAGRAASRASTTISSGRLGNRPDPAAASAVRRSPAISPTSTPSRSASTRPASW